MEASIQISAKEKDASALVKIKNFLRDHPSLIYKGIPLACLGWATWPYFLIYWKWLPLVLSGYNLWAKLPPGTLTIIWAALKLYRNKGSLS